MEITGLDVYRAYCKALMDSPHKIDDAFIAKLFIPLNWEDEPQAMKDLFEGMAANIMAAKERRCSHCGKPTGSTISTICDECFDKQ